MNDVAALAGVSMATVSRVLAGDYPVAGATRERVLRAVRDLDYVVNAQARALAGRRSRTVAILLGNLAAPFHNRVAHGVERQAVDEGCLCLVAATDDDPDRELTLVEEMRARDVEAVVLVGGVEDSPGYRTRIARLAGILDEAGSRLVLCGRPAPGEELPLTAVHYDNAGGARAAVDHLLTLGHRRILFLGGPAATTTTRERLAGHQAALAAQGLGHPAELTVEGCHTRDGARAWLRRRLAQGPPDFSAVFAHDDDVAAVVLTVLREHGISVPEQVSVIGFNDLPGAEDLRPGLTTVRIPHLDLGRTALRLALHRPGPEPQRAVLATELVPRGSTGPVG
ncbi:LacI family DNA-binding transcriptional regulator [Kitasatospora sp. NPDC058397]|uniref:LacI family DNA-binding transcriptional regulator n=1 Tax=unclassified Kitasatospora TaxID=2633591 RepID=UPI003660CD38